MTVSTLERLKGKAVPVIRTGKEETARRLVGWLGDGGISIFEITTSVPGHVAIIRDLSSERGLLVGAGTILNADAARQAIEAGARFLVSPCVVPDVIAAGVAAGIPVIPGAATPTEALEAHRAGAAAVKLFPIRQLGGPGYVTAVRSVLPDVAFVPTGGIEIDEIGSYLAAGAYAVGLGGQLAAQDEIAAGRKEPVLERAARLAEYA